MSQFPETTARQLICLKPTHDVGYQCDRPCDEKNKRSDDGIHHEQFTAKLPRP
jgi:hypothetical protein